MIEIKSDFSGGLNLDDALYNLPRNTYIDGLNITRDSIEGSNDKAITNIVGNQLVNYTYPNYSSLINITASSTTVGFQVDQTISFASDYAIPNGFVINVYLRTVPGNVVTLVATYTTAYGDTLLNITDGLALSMTTIAAPGLFGISSVPVSLTLSQFKFSFLTTGGGANTYIYYNTTIVKSFYGFNFCIGAYANQVTDTVIYFIWNSMNYHLVLEYDNATRTISPIFTNLVDSGNIDILEFSKNNKITSINVYNRSVDMGEGDLLFFLDSLGRPTFMDIARFKVKEYAPVTRDIIDVAKRPPLFPPTTLYTNNIYRNTNNLRNKLFRFKTRYVYDANEKSTCSPISVVPTPVNILNADYTNINTNNNQIDLTLYSGDKDVRKVELLMSYVNKTNDWSDFALVDTIDKNVSSLLRGSFTITNPPPFFISLCTMSFDGYVVPGTTVEINIIKDTDPPFISYTVASYTTVEGDTMAVLTNNLVAQLNASLIIGAIVGKSSDNVIYFTLLPGYSMESGNPLASRNGLNITFSAGAGDFNNINFAYSFYNDGTYPVIDINESIQLFDYVPTYANAQEMPNGNVLMYGGITEGYDRDLIPSVLNNVLTRESASTPTGSLNSQLVKEEAGARIDIDFNGSPAVGTVVTIYFHSLAAPTVKILMTTYTTVAGDTAASVAYNLKQNFPPLYLGYYVVSLSSLISFFQFGFPTYRYDSVDINTSSLAQNDNSVPTFLFSTSRKLGIAYFDNKGKTNGILYNGVISFPAYAENAGGTALLLPYINTNIFHQPPIWATSYGFYLTKESTQFLFWQTLAQYEDPDYYYFNISNLTEYQKAVPTVTAVLSYTFQDGDRLRLIKKVSTGTIYDETYDTAIEGQVVDPASLPAGTIPLGTYIKIKKSAPFTSVTGLLGSNPFIIQLYRPSQPQPNGINEVYYEFGQQYPVGDPGLTTRFHIGMVANQNIALNTPSIFNFYQGDVYFRKRSYAFTNATARYTATFPVLDRNFVDNYISAVNSVEGRSNIIDINAREAYYSTLVRFSEAYQANTNINGTNRFYPNNFDEYDYSYGDIMRFKVRDRFVRVFQKLKVGQVPLYNQILKEQNKESLVVTDRLLNPIQYYVGDVGIGDNSESLASYNFADYFTSNIKGVICRVSQDGVKFISIDRSIDSWAWKQISARSGDYKIYGCFDQILGNYIIALEQVISANPQPAYTLLYGENENSFDTFLSYHPEMMVNLGVLFISFKDGQLYTHDSSVYNNFYGAQYDSSITFVFNEAPLDKKTFLAIGEVASQVWDVPEIITDLNSYGTTKMQSNLVDSDFAELEGSFEATILKDQNSIGGLIEGDTMKGKVMTMKFRAKDPTSLVSLNLLSLKYINSPLNNR